MRCFEGLALAVVLATQAAAAAPPWPGWQTIIYQPQSAAELSELRPIGVTGFMVRANRAAPTELGDIPTPDLRFYVENIATDFYAAYHRWRPDRPVNAEFLAVQARHARDPRDPTVFERDPSLADPAWQAKINARLAATVTTYRRFNPLYYNLADEAGIADLATAWDFDFSPSSLTQFQNWLRAEYRTLAALNAEWGSHWASWDAVRPDTTDAAMSRTDGNFSPWSDFKDFADWQFAAAVRAGTDAVHQTDPTARAGLEGAQIPGWGGYDYTRLATVVDVMEIYDAGENISIAQSLNPSLTLLTTVVPSDPDAAAKLWWAALQGQRGAILWDETGAMRGPAGQKLAPVLSALEGGPGAAWLAANPAPAQVAILYDPQDFRLQWLLDHRAAGPAWAKLGADDGGADNAVRASLRGFANLAGQLGVPVRYVTLSQISPLGLEASGIRVLILPHALALGAAQAAEVASFAVHGGLVVADTVPGAFDAHGRARATPALADAFVPGSDSVLFKPAPSQLPAFAALLRRAGIIPAATVNGAAGAVKIFWRGPFLALIPAPDSPGGAVTLAFDHPARLLDLRTHRSIGPLRELKLTLDPQAPAMFQRLGPRT